MQYNTLRYEVEDAVLVLTLNRPDKLNAFTIEMAHELIDAFGRASEDDAVSAVVVTGEGRAFCAGMDLSGAGNVFGLDESRAPTLDDLEQRLEDPGIIAGVRDTGGRVTLAIFECKKPVIAAINGPAVGIGATMTCAMDIRLASHNARIGFVFNRIGITPEACSTWFLPRIVGLSRALEWTYTAEVMSAEDALEGGLLRTVVPPEQLMEDACALARRIAAHSPVAVALTRQMMYRNAAAAHPLEAHKVESLAVFYTSLASGKEGVAAFLEKREAHFDDRASTGMPPFYPWWR